MKSLLVWQLCFFFVYSITREAQAINPNQQTATPIISYFYNTEDGRKENNKQESLYSKPQQYVLKNEERLLADISSRERQHQFRIFPHINPPPEYAQIDQSLLAKAMSIASTYFKKALTVTDRHTIFQTTLVSANPICNIALQSYKYQGFNPSNYDAVIATHYQKQFEVQSTVIAYGSNCKKLHWTIYGAVTFITDNFKMRKSDSNIKFYKDLMTILHQYIHILVFDTDLMDGFFIEYQTSKSIYNKQDILINSSKEQYMLTSPLVKSYIQSVFNCSQDIGAILQNYRTNSTERIHWNSLVFYDQAQVITPTPFLFITNLTLSLFGDSHFFKSVNYSMGEPIVYGKGKGCDFALGKARPHPQFCDKQTQIYDCDFHNIFKGICRQYKSNESNNASIMIDLDSQTRDYSDPSKRCIKTGTPGLWKYSYEKAVCSSGQVLVQINNITIKCTQDGEKLEIGKQGIYVVCPNPQAFCARKLCPNWCSKQGICVRGQCLMDSPVQKQQLKSPGLLFLAFFVMFFGASLYFCWTWGSPKNNGIDMIQNQSQQSEIKI